MRLRPTPEYEAAKAALTTKNARATLRVVEGHIEAEGLLVSYRISGEVVDLLDVIDVKRAPRWPWWSA